MNTIVLLALTGLGLSALYFLVAAGLSMVFGLADVLNFAHGLFVAVGAYASYLLVPRVPGGYVVGLLLATLVGTGFGVLVEYAVIRPLYGRPVQQVLATVGLSLSGTAALVAVFGPDTHMFPNPPWATSLVHLGTIAVPTFRLLLIAAAAVVCVVLAVLIKRTRLGLVIRAGVENREMVTALGIDVRRAFTIVFGVAGGVAALAGGLAGTYFSAIAPDQGNSMLIFAIVVVVIGGLGTITGTAAAAVVVGLLQQFANYYGAVGLGDISVLVLLSVMLLVRPRGLVGGRTA